MSQREQAYEAIRKVILEGEVPIGETQSERKFAETYLRGEELGRTPIREALAVLALRGLIRQLPQVGFSVPPVRAPDAERTVQIRHAMEGVIVEQLPENLAGNRMGGTVDRMKRAAKNEDSFEFMTAVRDFHVDLCKSADYAQEAQGVGAFYDRLQLYFCTVRQPIRHEEMDKMADLYERFLERAIESDVRSAVRVFQETAQFELALIRERAPDFDASEVGVPAIVAATA